MSDVKRKLNVPVSLSEARSCSIRLSETNSMVYKKIIALALLDIKTSE